MTGKQKLLLLIAMAYMVNAFGQEKLKIFKTKIKAEEVTGRSKFNDLGVIYSTDVIDDLTDDTATYLWRIGSIRLDYKNYKKGAISLFDLSVSNHKGGYPILDNIDFTYYHDIGFNILESREPTLINDQKYLDFKKSLNDSTKHLLTKRNILWQDANYNFRNKLLATRYFENEQLISDDVVKKITNELTANVAIDLSGVVQYAKTIGVNIDTTKADIKSYFKKTISKHLNLKGYYTSAIFQYKYIDMANYIISNLDLNAINKIPNDEFNEHLMYYIKSDSVALNSAIFAFKFRGSYSQINFDTTSLKATLKADITTQNLIKLSTNLNDQFSKQVSQTFTNNFSKVWIIEFGTDAILNELKLKDIDYTEKKP